MPVLSSLPKHLSRLCVLLAIFSGPSWGVNASTTDLIDPVIQVSNLEDTLVLNITYQVPVGPREAWAVLTDFENMPDFISNLESSKVLQRSGKMLLVEQKGVIDVGMLPIHYESRRQLDLLPFQNIRSHSLSGNIHLNSTMVLTPISKGTLLSYHATATPDLPVPKSLLGSYISKMLDNQFKSMGKEMLRRAQLDEADDENDLTATAQQPAQQGTSRAEQKTPSSSIKQPATKTSQPPQKKAKAQPATK